MFQKPSPTIALSQEEEPKQTQADSVETVVGPSVQVEGDFVSEGDIIVKGIVSGSVRTSRKVHVEEGAKIFANVKAGDATISGEVKGNMRASGTVELTQSARVEGDIDCGILIVEAGALILGKVSMKGIDIQGPKNDRKRLTKSTKSKLFSSDDETETEVM